VLSSLSYLVLTGDVGDKLLLGTADGFVLLYKLDVVPGQEAPRFTLLSKKVWISLFSLRKSTKGTFRRDLGEAGSLSHRLKS